MKTITITEVNQEAIDKYNDRLKIMLDYAAWVFEMFTNKGIPIQLEDIHQIVGLAIENPEKPGLETLIIQRLLELPQNEELSKMPIMFVKERLKMPNWISITTSIYRTPMKDSKSGIDITFFEVYNGEVVKKKDADNLIKEKFTKRTLIPDYKAINGKKKTLNNLLNNFKNK